LETGVAEPEVLTCGFATVDQSFYLGAGGRGEWGTNLKGREHETEQKNAKSEWAWRLGGKKEDPVG